MYNPTLRCPVNASMSVHLIKYSTSSESDSGVSECMIADRFGIRTLLLPGWPIHRKVGRAVDAGPYGENGATV